MREKNQQNRTEQKNTFLSDFSSELLLLRIWRLGESSFPSFSFPEHGYVQKKRWRSHSWGTSSYGKVLWGNSFWNHQSTSGFICMSHSVHVLEIHTFDPSGRWISKRNVKSSAGRTSFWHSSRPDVGASSPDVDASSPNPQGHTLSCFTEGKGQAVHGRRFFRSFGEELNGVWWWSGQGSLPLFPFGEDRLWIPFLAVTPSLSLHISQTGLYFFSFPSAQHFADPGDFVSSLKYISSPSSNWFRGSKEPSYRTPKPWDHVTKARWL